MTKRFGLRRCFHTLLYIVLMLPLATMLSGCEMLYEDEGDCSVKYHVAFRYVNNIVEADAFANQVKSVTLFVYDKQGNLVTSVSEEGEALKQKDYLMKVDVPAGVYDLVAWCGLADGRSFILNGGSMPNKLEEAKCKLIREQLADGAPVSSKALAPLFHAIERDVEFPDTNKHTVVCTMDLTKDTNTIRLILTHYNGGRINPDDFTFAISDNNGYLAYDNSLLPDDIITYTEWSKRSMDTTDDEVDNSRATVSEISSMIAEVDVSRIMVGHEMRLVINAEGKEEPVLSLPLVQLLLHAKGEARSQMSDQRYLDCQDEYNLVFFINDDNGWYMSGGIYINGWHMRYQSSDI